MVETPWRVELLEELMKRRIGSSSSQLYIANADGTDKRMLTDSLWDDAMPLYIPAKVY
jgi:hypothetical protein